MTEEFTKDGWPKIPKWVYVTPEGLWIGLLTLTTLLFFIMYASERYDYVQLIQMRESYDSAFCTMRGKVDRIQDYIGAPRS